MPAVRAGAIGGLFVFSLLAQQSTAGLTGKITDITGAAISGTQVDLQSETVSSGKFRVFADAAGVYNFSRLPAAKYTLTMVCPGSSFLRIKSILISDGEQKALPTMQLEVGSMGDCGGHAVLDYLVPLPPGDRLATLRGTVRIDDGGSPLAGADVTLICFLGQVCGETKTSSDGEFTFKAPPEMNLSVRVSQPGFYPLDVPRYAIQKGFESVYQPISAERCHSGNCDPKLRREKPIAVCE